MSARVFTRGRPSSRDYRYRLVWPWAGFKLPRAGLPPSLKSPTARALLAHIEFRVRWMDGCCDPLATIAATLGVDRRTLANALSNLVRDDLLIRVRSRLLVDRERADGYYAAARAVGLRPVPVALHLAGSRALNWSEKLVAAKVSEAAHRGIHLTPAELAHDLGLSRRRVWTANRALHRKGLLRTVTVRNVS